MKPPAGPASAIAPAVGTPAVVADAATATQAARRHLGPGTGGEEGARRRREGGGHQHRREGRRVPGRRQHRPGQPVVRDFVTWSLEKAGHGGGGWAGVQTWVRAAEAKTNDLKLVNAADARPGDIVVYDWGGQGLRRGRPHRLPGQQRRRRQVHGAEGNNQDAVMSVPRSTSQANVKFLRIKGDAPPRAAAPSAPLAAARRRGGSPAAGRVGWRRRHARPARGRRDARRRRRRGRGGRRGRADPYPGDDAGKEQLAAWMSKEAEKRGLPPQLPVILVESASKAATPELRSASSRCASGSGTRASTPATPRAAGQVVPRPGRAGQKAARRRRRADRRPQLLRRVDRRRRTPRQAVPRPLPAQARRSQRPARQRRRPAPPAAAAAAPAPAAPAAAADAADAPKKDRGDEMQFMAAKAEAAKEAAHKHRATVQFMKAVDPKQAGAAGAPAAGPQVAAAAAAAAPATGPTAAEDAAANQAVGAPVPEGELALQNVARSALLPGRQRIAGRARRGWPRRPRRPASRPELVMASLVESGVKNLKGGDADSAGFFQMRVGIWDNGPYKGFRMNPQLRPSGSSTTLLQVKKARLAAGKSVTDPVPRGVDRGHRAPGRAVPLQVPAAPDRGARDDRG